MRLEIPVWLTCNCLMRNYTPARSPSGNFLKCLKVQAPLSGLTAQPLRKRQGQRGSRTVSELVGAAL